MMDSQKNDFYQNLRKTFKNWSGNSKWGEYLMMAPDLFHLLCKLALDTDVSVKDKAKLASAIAYFVAPIDVIPEALVGPVGYLDDIALAAYVLNSIVNQSGKEVVEKHWAGDRDVLEVIRQILDVADEMLGSGLWEKIKKFIG